VNAEQEAVLRAVHTIAAKKPAAVRLKDVAEASLGAVDKTADVLGELMREGHLRYNLKTGFTIEQKPQSEEKPKTESSSAVSATKPLVESPPSYSGGVGGRAVGARTLFPLSFQTITDLSQKKFERMHQADETRKRTRERLRQLAQETTEKLTRRPLKSLGSDDARQG